MEARARVPHGEERATRRGHVRRPAQEGGVVVIERVLVRLVAALLGALAGVAFGLWMVGPSRNVEQI